MHTDLVATGSRSPIVVDDLPAGDYLFTVTATDGTGARATRTTTVPVAVTQVLNPAAAPGLRDTTVEPPGAVALGRVTGIRPPAGTELGTAFTISRRGSGGPGAPRVRFALHAPTGLTRGARVTVSLWVLNLSAASVSCAVVLADGRRGVAAATGAGGTTVPPDSPWVRFSHETTLSAAGTAGTAVVLQLPADGPLDLRVTGVSVAAGRPAVPAAAVRPGRTDPASFATARPVGPAGAFTLLAADDFVGDALDRSRWWDGRYGTGSQGDPAFNPRGEAEYFAASQVSVGASLLTLTADRGDHHLDGVDYTYRSGCVTSSGGLRFTPVGTYVEARIRVDSATGLWPAFWLASADGYRSEFDIFEFVSTDTDVRPSYNYHYTSAGSDQVDRQTYLRSYGAPGHVYPGDFHTYGLLTTATSQTPYLDGVAYPAAAVTGLATRDDPVEIIFSLAVKTAHSPRSGHAMDVDWVRVWRTAPGGGR